MIPYIFSGEEKAFRKKKSKRPWERRYKERFEEELGVLLEEDEDVHHIDYNKHHGCINNLMCLKKDDHKKLHKKARLHVIKTCSGNQCQNG